MNLLLAAHALGYVGGWVTGWRTYSEQVRAAFCGPGERIAGFIFLGHAGRDLDERPRAPLATVWRPWQPPTN
jgi:nitroreductase